MRRAKKSIRSALSGAFSASDSPAARDLHWTDINVIGKRPLANGPTQGYLYVNVFRAGTSGEITAGAQTRGMHNEFIVDPVGVQA